MSVFPQPIIEKKLTSPLYVFFDEQNIINFKKHMLEQFFNDNIQLLVNVEKITYSYPYINTTIDYDDKYVRYESCFISCKYVANKYNIIRIKFIKKICQPPCRFLNGDEVSIVNIDTTNSEDMIKFFKSYMLDDFTGFEVSTFTLDDESSCTKLTINDKFFTFIFVNLKT